MRRRTIDATTERRIVTGMIVSAQFLREIRTIYRPDLVETDFARTVAGWCLDFFLEHETAPGKQIEDLFHSWYNVTKDDTQADLIEDFLGGLSDEHEHASHYNVAYHLKKAESYFKEKAMKNLAEDIQAYLSQGQVEDADKILTDFVQVSRPKSSGVNPMDDPDVMRRAFESRQEPLFQIPGALGVMMNPQFTRQSFIGILGPEKRGKTFRMIDLSMQAWRQGCNVAFFQVGDLSEEQFVRRQGIYLTRCSDDPRYCGEIKIPVMDCFKNQTDDCNSIYRTSTFGVIGEEETLDFETARAEGYVPCTECLREDKANFRPTVWWELRSSVKPITWREAFRQAQRVKKRHRAKGFKLSVHPNSSISVSEIDTILRQWEEFEGFVPDVILIDYADILAPEPGSKEFRHQENDKWKAMRRLNQHWNCCFITATQADADSYDKKSLGLKNFSEDKRKYAHVTAMYSLNQTPAEKQQRVMRFGELLVREDAFDQGKEATVLQCLEIGRPHLASYFDNSPKPKQEDEE